MPGTVREDFWTGKSRNCALAFAEVADQQVEGGLQVQGAPGTPEHLDATLDAGYQGRSDLPGVDARPDHSGLLHLLDPAPDLGLPSGQQDGGDLRSARRAAGLPHQRSKGAWPALGAG